MSAWAEASHGAIDRGKCPGSLLGPVPSHVPVHHEWPQLGVFGHRE